VSIPSIHIMALKPGIVIVSADRSILVSRVVAESKISREHHSSIRSTKADKEFIGGYASRILGSVCTLQSPFSLVLCEESSKTNELL